MSLLIAWFINELTPNDQSARVTLVFYALFHLRVPVYLIRGVIFSDDSYGYANAWLQELGIITDPILWFHDEKYVMGLCIVVALWTSLGTSFLSFIAGLSDHRQVARCSGRGRRVSRTDGSELWYITLPTMKPQLMFGAVMSITGSFGFGGVVTALSQVSRRSTTRRHAIMQHCDRGLYGGTAFRGWLLLDHSGLFCSR